MLRKYRLLAGRGKGGERMTEGAVVLSNREELSRTSRGKLVGVPRNCALPHKYPRKE